MQWLPIFLRQVLLLYVIVDPFLVSGQVIVVKVYFLLLRDFFHRQLLQLFMLVGHQRVFFPKSRLKVLYIKFLVIFPTLFHRLRDGHAQAIDL